MFSVRVWFDWGGREVYEDLGPFDRYFAELMATSFPEMPYVFGLTEVHVKRSLIVPALDRRLWTF